MRFTLANNFRAALLALTATTVVAQALDRCADAGSHGRRSCRRFRGRSPQTQTPPQAQPQVQQPGQVQATATDGLAGSLER